MSQINFHYGLTANSTRTGATTGAIFGTNVGAQNGTLNQTIAAQGMANTVPDCDRKPDPLRYWITAIEKYVMLIGATDDQTCLIVYQSAKDLIQRYLSENAQCDWAQLRRELTARFSPVSDPQHVLTLFRGLKQTKNEGMSLYLEWLLNQI